MLLDVDQERVGGGGVGGVQMRWHTG
jgi:hypothetical protein